MQIRFEFTFETCWLQFRISNGGGQASPRGDMIIVSALQLDLARIQADLRLQQLVASYQLTVEQATAGVDRLTDNADKLRHKFNATLSDQDLMKPDAHIIQQPLCCRVEFTVGLLNLPSGDSLVEFQFAAGNKSLADKTALLTSRAEIADFGRVISRVWIRIQPGLSMCPPKRINPRGGNTELRMSGQGETFEREQR